MLKQEDIRDAQAETLRQTIRLTSNLTRNSTLVVFTYLLEHSSDAPPHVIAAETGLSIRSVRRHLERIHRHPIASKIFTDTHARTRTL